MLRTKGFVLPLNLFFSPFSQRPFRVDPHRSDEPVGPYITLETLPPLSARVFFHENQLTRIFYRVLS